MEESAGKDSEESEKKNFENLNIPPPSPYQTPVINNISSIISNNWLNTPSPVRYPRMGNDIVNELNDDEPDDYEPDGDELDDDDDDCQVMTSNPEPPKEFIDENLLKADAIGDTAFSKRWVLSTLLNILKYVEDDDMNQLVELDEEFQDGICQLWDMSMNDDVVIFLHEHQTISLLIRCIEKSNSPRAKEMCIGIIGNMMCSPNIFQMYSGDEAFISFLFSLFECDDPPVLTETLRLLTTCISFKEHCQLWIAAIKQSQHILTSILFILQSSTNVSLLRSTAEFVSKLFDVSDEMCLHWSCPDLVLAVLEAFKQTGSFESKLYDELMSVLQSLSTTENGVQALVTYAGEICILCLGYLRNLCDDVLLVIVGNENVIAATVSVVNVLFLHWDANMDFINQDYSFVRVVLKFLEALKELPIIYKINIDGASTENGSGDHEMAKDGSHDKKDEHSVYRLIRSLLITLLKDALNLLLKIDGPGGDVTSAPRSLQYIEKYCSKERLLLVHSCLGDDIHAWLQLADKFKCVNFKKFLLERSKFQYSD